MSLWLTARECVNLPGLPGREHNIRIKLNKFAEEIQASSVNVPVARLLNSILIAFQKWRSRHSVLAR